MRRTILLFVLFAYSIAQGVATTVTLTDNHNLVAGDDVNIPLLIDGNTILAHDPNFWSEVNGTNELWISDRNDTNLPRQMVYFSKDTNTMILRVCLPEVSSTVDLNYYFHYGNPGLNEGNDFNTWDVNHVCVQSMVYDYNANGQLLNPLLTFTDSTVNAHVGTMTNYFGTVLTLDANSNDINCHEGVAYNPTTDKYALFHTSAVYLATRSGNDLTITDSNTNILNVAGIPVITGYTRGLGAGCFDPNGKIYVPCEDVNDYNGTCIYQRILVLNTDLTPDTNVGGGSGIIDINQNDNNNMCILYIDINYIYVATYAASGPNSVYRFNYPSGTKADSNLVFNQVYNYGQGLCKDGNNDWIVVRWVSAKFRIDKFSDLTGNYISNIYTVNTNGAAENLCYIPTTNSFGILNDNGGTLQNIEWMSYHSSGGGTDKWGSPIIKFDGANDYILMPDAADWDFGTGNFSISAWANYSYINPTLAYGAILARAFSTNTLRFAVSDGSGANQSIYTKLGGTSVWRESNDINVVINTWHHFAFARNGTNWTWYFDGNECNSITVSPAFDMTSATGVYIGLTNTATMNGYLSDIRISNTNRSGSWFKTIFNNENDPNGFWTVSTPTKNCPCKKDE